jgi:hypothetical protein
MAAAGDPPVALHITAQSATSRAQRMRRLPLLDSL